MANLKYDIKVRATARPPSGGERREASTCCTAPSYIGIVDDFMSSTTLSHSQPRRQLIGATMLMPINILRLIQDVGRARDSVV